MSIDYLGHMAVAHMGSYKMLGLWFRVQGGYARRTRNKRTIVPTNVGITYPIDIKTLRVQVPNNHVRI